MQTSQKPKFRALALALSAALSITALTLSSTTFAKEAKQEAPKPQVLFTNVNIFDGKNGKLNMDMNVLVEGNLIKIMAKLQS